MLDKCVFVYVMWECVCCNCMWVICGVYMLFLFSLSLYFIFLRHAKLKGATAKRAIKSKQGGGGGGDGSIRVFPLWWFG